jgi:hypothetical protein
VVGHDLGLAVDDFERPFGAAGDALAAAVAQRLVDFDVFGFLGYFGWWAAGGGRAPRQ